MPEATAKLAADPVSGAVVAGAVGESETSSCSLKISEATNLPMNSRGFSKISEATNLPTNSRGFSRLAAIIQRDVGVKAISLVLNVFVRL